MTAAGLCFHRRAVSQRPPQPQSRQTLGAGQLQLGSGSNRSSSSSASSSSVAAAAPPRPSTSSRELSQRFAPPRPDWPAGRAASQWSRSEAASPAAPALPAEPSAAGRPVSAGAGQPPARPGGAGRTLRGERAPGWSRGGRWERDAPGSGSSRPADSRGGGEHGVTGRSRWGWSGRCGYLAPPHLRAGPAGWWLVPREESWLRCSLSWGGSSDTPKRTTPGAGIVRAQRGATAKRRCPPRARSQGAAGTGFRLPRLEPRPPWASRPLRRASALRCSPLPPALVLFAAKHFMPIGRSLFAYNLIVVLAFV